MSEEGWQSEVRPMDLLKQLEKLLESDPLIDEVGFIHPSQFTALCGTIQSEVSEANTSNTIFWLRDHKLGISTQVLFPLYNAAKQAFTDALKQYKLLSTLSALEVDSGGENVSISCLPCTGIEKEVLEHSRALLLLSCDFGTAWNARKLVVSKRQHFPLFLDELHFSSLVLSYSHKSECAWSHRRWVIKMIAGECPTLQEIVEKESVLTKKIAEISKMNYRAWYHHGWLVSYMSAAEVLHELNKSRDWAQLHVADNSIFHYRARLMLKLLENTRHKQDLCESFSSAEVYHIWKEELDWDEKLIKLYVGREALWLYRRFLSMCWIKYFAPVISELSSCQVSTSSSFEDIDFFLNSELQLFHFCSSIPDDDFEDFRGQATFSAIYLMWLAKQFSESLGIELQNKLPERKLKTLINECCPEKTFLWDLSTQPGTL